MSKLRSSGKESLFSLCLTLPLFLEGVCIVNGPNAIQPDGTLWRRIPCIDEELWAAEESMQLSATGNGWLVPTIKLVGCMPGMKCTAKKCAYDDAVDTGCNR